MYVCRFRACVYLSRGGGKGGGELFGRSRRVSGAGGKVAAECGGCSDNTNVPIRTHHGHECMHTSRYTHRTHAHTCTAHAHTHTCRHARAHVHTQGSKAPTGLDAVGRQQHDARQGRAKDGVLPKVEHGQAGCRLQRRCLVFGQRGIVPLGLVLFVAKVLHPDRIRACQVSVQLWHPTRTWRAAPCQVTLPKYYHPKGL